VRSASGVAFASGTGSAPSSAKATPEAPRTLLKSEIDKWTPVIRKTGVYAD